MHDHARHTHGAGDGVREAETKKVTVVGAIVNLALAAGKLVAGILGGSTAMVADAFHSLSDLVTDAMVYVSVSIASLEADEDHPYGHGRAETIGAAGTGAALLLVGVLLLFEIVEKVAAGTATSPTWPAVAGAVVSILVKEFLYHYTVRIGRKYNNNAIIANAWHHRTDSVSSVAALAGIAGAMMGFPILDPLAAVLVVLMIGKVGWEILWDSLQELMDVSLSPEKQEEITGIISNSRGVISHHELRTRKLGGDMFIDVHIQVQPNISVSEAHNIAETVRRDLRVKGGATDALVHIDAEEDLHYQPVKLDRDGIEREVRETALRIDGIKDISSLIIHYLGGKTQVEFNVDIDEDLTIGQAKQIVARLRETLNDGDRFGNVVIRGRLTDDTISNDNT